MKQGHSTDTVKFKKIPTTNYIRRNYNHQSYINHRGGYQNVGNVNFKGNNDGRYRGRRTPNYQIINVRTPDVKKPTKTL